LDRSRTPRGGEDGTADTICSANGFVDHGRLCGNNIAIGLQLACGSLADRVLAEFVRSARRISHHGVNRW
jgi:hypothetical protein